MPAFTYDSFHDGILTTFVVRLLLIKPHRVAERNLIKRNYNSYPLKSLKLAAFFSHVTGLAREYENNR